MAAMKPQLPWLLLLAFSLPACSDATTIGNQDDDANQQAQRIGDILESADDDASSNEQSPVVSFLAPDSGDYFLLGEPIAFSATISDLNDGLSSLSYVWESDQDGVLEEGTPTGGTLVLTTSDLSGGLHLVTLTVSDPDEHEGSDTLEIIVNSPPEATTVVEITPEKPTTQDALLAVVTVAASDPDGDPVGYTFSWFVDDASAGIASATVPATETAAGEVWQVSAVPDDGYHHGTAAMAAVIIQNTLPTIAKAMVLPSAGGTDTTFACTAEGWSDADGEAQSYTVQWLVNGEPVADQTSDTITGEHYEKGDILQCVLTPTDASGQGNPILSEEIPILDTAPSVDTVTLDPDEGDKTTTFQCLAEGLSDPDEGDEVDLMTIWKVNEEELEGTTSQTFNASSLAQGATLQCKVVPFQGDIQGQAVYSDEVVLGNAAPYGGAVVVSPVAPTELTGVNCISNDASDPDGDTFSLSYTWYVDDELVPDVTGNFLSGAYFDKGQKVTCEVTAYDGMDYGTPVGAKNLYVTAVNSPPTLLSATISPDEGSKNTSFTCLPGEVTDPDPADADGFTFSYAWTFEGDTVPSAEVEFPTDAGTTAFQTIIPQGLSSGVLVCMVTPNDGIDDGAPVESTPAIITNHHPSIDDVELGPEPATELDELLCQPKGWFDEDDDDEGYTYTWSVDSVTVEGATDATLTGEHFDKGQLVVCIATPWDGSDAGSAKASNPVIIGNSAPSLLGATLEPPTGGKLTEFLCAGVVGDTPDPDLSDTLAFAYQWFLDDVLIDGETQSKFIPGALVGESANLRCEVRPYDLKDYGQAVSAGPSLVTNLPPSVTSASIQVDNSGGIDGLRCTPSGAIDPDGDEVEITTTWLVNATLVDGFEGEKLDDSHYGKDDEVQCVVTPSDGHLEGDSVPSNIYLVGNTGPTTPIVTVAPDKGAPGEALTCEGESTDLDGDFITYTYIWARNGVMDPVYITDTIQASTTLACEEWTCFVTATDGIAPSDYGEGSVTVAPAGEGGSTGAWYGQHSFNPTSNTSPTTQVSQFAAVEEAATMVTPPAGDFPMTISHMAVLLKSGQVTTLRLYNNANGQPGNILTSATTTGTGMYQIVELPSAVTIETSATLWASVQGQLDFMTVYGDGDGQSTSNLIYGCDMYFPGMGCVEMLGGTWAWRTFASYGAPFNTSGDIIIDIGTGSGTSSCP
jgi:hypothetical protein